MGILTKWRIMSDYGRGRFTRYHLYLRYGKNMGEFTFREFLVDSGITQERSRKFSKTIIGRIVWGIYGNH